MCSLFAERVTWEAETELLHIDGREVNIMSLGSIKDNITLEGVGDVCKV